MTVRILQGDCREVMAALPEQSVHCCVTSPPYYSLRDYKIPPSTWGDGWVGQLGLEPTLDQYIAHIVEVFRSVWRVLRDDGTLWLNIGDSYANDGKWGGSSGGKHAAALHGSTGIGRQKVSTGLKPKDLMMVPARVALALQADGWYLRSEIVWAKRAPMPESVRDRPTSAHEKIYLLSKRSRYFYDAEAVKEENSSPEQLAHNLKYAKPYAAYDERSGETGQPGNVNNVGIHSRPGSAGRNQRNVWWMEAPMMRLRDDLPSDVKLQIVGELVSRGLL